ncbi:MAG TPA: glycosyl hydrolase family 8 [Candidatus Binatia bacterium]|jgi:endo-1,4-beta-D-glucanase Y|nr:glycosyl hydrolase family 8 [Candidatus Binatia bacterium]
MRRITALVLLVLLAGCARQADETPMAFLGTAWRDYVPVYVMPDGYVLDRTRGPDGEVVSEAQGYALLRAAWMRDADTFDRVLTWTERTLRRPDGLYSWRWSPANGGTMLDSNTATDADQEIALALIMGAAVFDRPWLVARAAELLRAVRAHESIVVGDGWFPAAGNWAVDERIVNLSYFLPYAYDAFARIDPEGRWDQALTTGYALLAAVMAPQGVAFPPDFMTVDAAGAPGPLPAGSKLSAAFSFDAVRLYARVAMDCRVSGRAAACADTLHAAAVARRLDRDGRIVTKYSVDGTPESDVESLSFYGCLLPAFERHAPEAARQLLAGRLSQDALRPILRAPDRYYDLNWVWFGLAVSQGFPST